MERRLFSELSLKYGKITIQQASALAIANPTHEHIIGRDDHQVAISVRPLVLEADLVDVIRTRLASGLPVMYARREPALEVRYGKLYEGGRIEDVSDPMESPDFKDAPIRQNNVHIAVAQLASEWAEWKKKAQEIDVDREIMDL